MYTIFIKWRVNLASPLERSRNVDEFQLSLSYASTRCDFCHTAGFKSRQTARVRTLRFSLSSLLYLSRSLEGIPRAERDRWKSAACFTSSTASLAACLLFLSYIYRIVYTRLVSHPTISILWNITIRGLSLAAAFLNGVNHLTTKLEFISFDVLFPWYYYYNSIYLPTLIDFVHAHYRFKYKHYTLEYRCV